MLRKKRYQPLVLRFLQLLLNVLPHILTQPVACIPTCGGLDGISPILCGCRWLVLNSAAHFYS